MALTSSHGHCNLLPHSPILHSVVSPSPPPNATHAPPPVTPPPCQPPSPLTAPPPPVITHQVPVVGQLCDLLFQPAHLLLIAVGRHAQVAQRQRPERREELCADVVPGLGREHRDHGAHHGSQHLLTGLQVLVALLLHRQRLVVLLGLAEFVVPLLWEGRGGGVYTVQPLDGVGLAQSCLGRLS